MTELWKVYYTVRSGSDEWVQRVRELKGPEHAACKRGARLIRKTFGNGVRLRTRSAVRDYKAEAYAERWGS